jgi:hypothetical protein
MTYALRFAFCVAVAAVLWPGRRRRGAAEQHDLFITSAGTGKGGELGGLAGADQHCQQLAQAAGAGSRTWRAY